MASYLQTVRHFNRDVRLFLLTPAIMGFTVFGGISTVILNIYLLRLHYGPEFIGLVNAAGFLSTALFAMPGVSVGNRLGARRAMLIGMICCAIGYLLLPLGEGITGRLAQAWLLFTFMLANFGLTLYLVNSSPFLMEATASGGRNHAFSLQIAIWPLAGFVGSLIGGMLPGFFAGLLQVPLTSPAPYRYPLLVAACLIFPAVAVLAAIDPALDERTRTSPRVATTSSSQAWRLLYVMAAVGFLRVFAEGTGRSFFNVYLDQALQVPTFQIGLLVAVTQLVIVPVALGGPLLTARWGHGNLIIWGSIGAAIFVLPLALFPNWFAAGLGYMGILMLSSVSRLAYMVYTQEVAPAGWRTTMSGLTTLAVGLSWAFVSYGGGHVIATYGFPPFFLLGGLFTLGGALIFALHQRHARSH
jgi:MFS family permease